MNRRVRTTTLLAHTATIRTYGKWDGKATVTEYPAFGTVVTMTKGAFKLTAAPWTIFAI
jgi:hypothetical protein